MSLLELLQDLSTHWTVEIGRKAGQYVVTITSERTLANLSDPQSSHGSYTYKGKDLEHIIRRAWAGEPTD